MALLAEEIVEEWLNRQGYFTIRGVKLGVHEMDLLAIRPGPAGADCRHIEVQASVRPMSYLCDLPKAVQKATGRKARSARTRTEAEILQGAKEWVSKKFLDSQKQELRSQLATAPWTYELVVHETRYPDELRVIQELGIRIHRLRDVIKELKSGKHLVKGAAGTHLLDLIALAVE